MTWESYSYEDWRADLEIIYQIASESLLISDRSIQAFARQKYPAHDADEKAHCLCIFWSFVSRFGPELKECGLASPDGDIPELPVVMYRWLVLMSWEGLPPLPPKETIFRMLRGEE